MSGLVDLVVMSLEWLYGVTVNLGIPSYALAIVMLTVIIKVLLYPLTYKQMKSMKIIQQLQPKLKDLEKKYKNDPKKKQEAMLELYKEHGANPLSGCLPMLVQLPILFALFRALNTFHPAVPEHYNLFWIANLGQPDPTLALPILVGASTFAQQWITSPNPTDQTQKVLLYFMPILFGWMSQNFPAGLAFYWIIFSVVGTIQQLFINKGIKPVPVKEEAAGNEDNRKNR